MTAEEARGPALPFVAAAESLRVAGRHADALAALRDGERTHPDHLPARVVLARVQVDLGSRALAVEVLADVLRADPVNVEAAIALAEVSLADGRPELAAPYLPLLAGVAAPGLVAAIEARTLPPGGDRFDQPARAHRLAARGERRAARRIWERILARSPGNPAVEAELARLAEAPAPAEADGGPLPEWADPPRTPTIRAIRAWADRLWRTPAPERP